MSRHGLGAALLAGALALVPLAAPADEGPGAHFRIGPNDLPPPNATPAVENTSVAVPRPPGARPDVPPGFAISLFAGGLTRPRFIAVAPDGDVFLSESDAGKIVVLAKRHGRMRRSVFASGLAQPHGLAFHNGALYVADTEAIWAFAYKDGALQAGAKTRITAEPFPKGGHFTRDIAFAPDGTLYFAMGSEGNDEPNPLPRAAVSVVTADGKLEPFATGLRNPVGIAVYPGTDQVWVTVNERDGLGDNLPPDYLTHIGKGDFFGWPYAYIGPHPDPQWGAKRPDLVAMTKTPDLLFQAHSAPLGLVFYEGDRFPGDYKGDAFVALHGSWNRSTPTGYKVVLIKFKDGRPVGGYDNFVTGFHEDDTSPAKVWGRPVGLAVAKDGSLLITDDAGGAIWRVDWIGSGAAVDHSAQ